MSEIEVGTRVVCIHEWDGNELAVGKSGIVFAVDSDGAYDVEFDDDIGGHNGDGAHRDGHCWCFFTGDDDIYDYLMPEEKEIPIEISFDEVFS